MRPYLLELNAFGRRLRLPAYSAMLTVAFLVGWCITLLDCWRASLSLVTASVILAAGTFAAVPSGRLVYRLANRRHPERVGAHAIGGYVGSLLATAAAALVWTGQLAPFLWVMDLGAPQLALGMAITRVGCLLHGCDFGKRVSTASRLPSIRFPNWRVRYPQLQEQGSPAFLFHVSKAWVSAANPVSAPVHPVQLYWSLFGIALFVALRWFDATATGQPLLLFVLAYSLGSLALEPLRGDLDRGVFFGLSTTQWIALPLALGSAIALSVIG